MTIPSMADIQRGAMSGTHVSMATNCCLTWLEAYSTEDKLTQVCRPRSYYADKAGLEISEICLSLFSECWDQSYVPLYLAKISTFKYYLMRLCTLFKLFFQANFSLLSVMKSCRSFTYFIIIWKYKRGFMLWGKDFTL